MAIRALTDAGIPLRGRRALVMAAVDRWGLARAIAEAGCETRFGDFGSIGLPVTVPTLRWVSVLARGVLPVLSRMPFSVVYPVGEAEDADAGPLLRHAEWAELIAGDFLQIRPNLPADLRGKIVVTNTTTAADVRLLRERGVHLLVTTTPAFAGRSFGTNVIEAACRALIDKPDAAITPADLASVLARVPIRPELRVLNQPAAASTRFHENGESTWRSQPSG
jgi:hypothetical protein